MWLGPFFTQTVCGYISYTTKKIRLFWCMPAKPALKSQKSKVTIFSFFCCIVDVATSQSRDCTNANSYWHESSPVISTVPSAKLHLAFLPPTNFITYFLQNSPPNSCKKPGRWQTASLKPNEWQFLRRFWNKSPSLIII